MVAEEAQAVDRLPLLGEAERRQVLEEWNATEAEYPKEKCIHELFEEQVEKTPEAVAVVFEDQQTELRGAERQSQPAGALPARGWAWGRRREWGSAWSGVVEMVVGLLGILKAGGAYVPLDPAYPAERLRYMLEDSSARVVADQKLELARAVAGALNTPVFIWMETGRRSGRSSEDATR